MLRRIIRHHSAEVLLEEGREMLLDYYIIVDAVGTVGETCFEHYGIRIVKTMRHPCHTEEESCDICAITPMYTGITRIADTLHRNLVTPVSLHCVIDDMLAE